MQVGDMVQYARHSQWENGGLGVIVDTNVHQQYCIAWLDDIEDFGWDQVLDWKAQWYDPEDFEEDIIVV